MPISKYWISDSDVSALQQAREELSLRCMASLGFTSVSAQYGEISSSASTFGLPAISQAGNGQARYSADSPESGEYVAQSAVALADRQPTAAEDSAMYGRGTAAIPAGHSRIPAGGCWAQAGRTLYGSNAVLPADPRAIAVASEAYAMQAPAPRAALTRWSACMAGDGRHYATPTLAAADPKWNAADTASAQASTQAQIAASAESATATADAACRTESGLTQDVFTAEAAYQSQQLKVHLLAVEQSVKIVNGWLANARSAEASLALARPAVSGLTYFTGPVTYTDLGSTMYADMSMDLFKAKIADGTIVTEWPSSSTDNAQKWIYSNTLSNGCRVLAPNANEEYAVEDPGGSLADLVNANIWYYGYNPATWSTVDIESASGYPGGDYEIQNCQDWLYLNGDGQGNALVWTDDYSGIQPTVWF